ncbi:MAG: FAD-dependent oxidoreductase [Chlorobi bacterium]|nr:FAD-dependent oxidoreductase [Chlorobiota bacterium]
MEKYDFDLIIIGAGPAGLTAGIYASRAKTSTLILDIGIVGGQMVLTYEIANYPGVEQTSGFMLSKTMKKQAISFGCEIKSNVKITHFDCSRKVKKIIVNDSIEYNAKAVIIATGGRPRSLNAKGEEIFKGKGISYCATCDGDFYQNKEIIVVGGGNSALEEAVSLTKYASKVTVVHQFNYFQAFDFAIKEAKANGKIEYIMESTIVGFEGHEKLENVIIKNLKTGKEHYMKIDGVFIFIGYEPNTEFLKGKIDLNERNEILTNDDLATSLDGVFAAGDVRKKNIRQITTSVADGTIAAINAVNYIQCK